MGYSLESAAQIYREALRETVQRFSVLYIGEGVLLAAAGVLAILYPLITSDAIAVPLGILLIATAVLQGIVLYGLRSMPHFGFQLLAVVVTLLLAFLLLRDPLQARQTIIVLVIIYLMVQGVSRLVFGLSIRPFQHWEWVLGSGALGIALSLVLLGNLPEPATWLVGLLVGIELIGEGVAIAMLAWERKPAALANAKE
ncbi:MAG TPA: HdeD family acid-resistance protein [Devosia sp.]|nr:HdeD family acid-resistance protein [Devosia sp.]